MIKRVKCWSCGKEMNVKTVDYYNPYHLTIYDKQWKNRKNINKREYCTECVKKKNTEQKEQHEQYIKLKASMMMERAIVITEQQNIDVYEYREAIDAVSDMINESPERFRSSEEIVATIVLINQEIRVKNNFKVGTYIADIYIQSLSCIVEIDGYMHEGESRKLKDGTKDIYIRSLLGKEWEVVRIPTKYINENAENLLGAIIELKAKMMELRKQNNGLLPYDFSRTMNAVYNKILKR